MPSCCHASHKKEAREKSLAPLKSAKRNVPVADYIPNSFDAIEK